VLDLSSVHSAVCSETPAQEYVIFDIPVLVFFIPVFLVLRAAQSAIS